METTRAGSHRQEGQNARRDDRGVVERRIKSACRNLSTPEDYDGRSAVHTPALTTTRVRYAGNAVIQEKKRKWVRV
jgi:hypothetical protein